MEGMTAWQHAHGAPAITLLLLLWGDVAKTYGALNVRAGPTGDDGCCPIDALLSVRHGLGGVGCVDERRLQMVVWGAGASSRVNDRVAIQDGVAGAVDGALAAHENDADARQKEVADDQQQAGDEGVWRPRGRADIGGGGGGGSGGGRVCRG